MEQRLGDALTRFNRAFTAFRESIETDPKLAAAVLDGVDEWADQLRYKLTPHLEGEGCLVVAVTGGTNTGKSTVFNMLLGQRVSPVVATAAATRRPVLAAHPERAAACLEGKLVPEFSPRHLDDPASVVARETPSDALYVAEVPDLSEQLVFLDTPDVDSIDREHWDVADHIRAAGDVLVAVLTAEKYRDDRVVAFFREAQASGRVVIPLMNKADPADDYTTARMQLDTFCDDLGLDTPRFVVAHDFALADSPQGPVRSLDGAPDLRTYIEELDVPSIKERVYRDTVRHFAERAEGFLEQAEEVAHVLRSAAEEFEDRARRNAAKYDPIPGSEIGGLFHDFVQRRRGVVRRSIGAASKTVVRGVTVFSRSLSKAFRTRTTLEPQNGPQTDAELRAIHAETIERLTRDLAAGYIDTCRNFREPAAHLIANGVKELDVEAAVQAVVRQTLRAENISDEFRQHAHRMLEAWWQDHQGQRRVVEALDALLAITPAAIAVPIAIYTGPGLPEATLGIAGPVVEQFAARVFEYQFGDAMFDFLSPWKKEQQEALERAMRDHLTEPALHVLRQRLACFEGDWMTTMREARQDCLRRTTLEDPS